MTNKPTGFHFERDIELSHPPLVEAWIEIRWKLEPGEQPQIMRDPGFLFALGPFHERVKQDFPHREELPIVNIPENLTPHVVRYQFINDDRSALFQLGPGVATANVLSNYKRKTFFELIATLRESLLLAYQEVKLQTEAVTLRYRNVEPFDFTTYNVLDFISENLNTAISLPAYIPGPQSTGLASGIDLKLSFALVNPKGSGTLRIVTGTRNAPGEQDKPSAGNEVVLWELAVSSGGKDVPPLDEERAFNEWLEAANAVIHEWFFALIEGPLLSKYR